MHDELTDPVRPPTMNPADAPLFASLDQAVEDFCRFMQNLPPEATTQRDQGPMEVLAHLVFYHELYVAQAQAFLAGTSVDLPKGRYSELYAEAAERFRGVPIDEMVKRLRIANRRLGELCAEGDAEEIVVPIKTGIKPYRLAKLIPQVTSHIRNHQRQLQMEMRKGRAGFAE